jgi:tetratricopeptide (TPR) repeat protein
MRCRRLKSGQSTRVLSTATALIISCLIAAVPGYPQESSPLLTHQANDLALRCTVSDSSGHPLSGIPLDLRSSAPPLDEIQSVTEADGSYTFGSLREGEYLLTVAGGLLLPPKHVRVNGTTSNPLVVRLPMTLPGSSGHGSPLVSVQQLNVPAKVQEMSQKAYKAWLRSDFPQSRVLAQQTLQLRPDYGPALELLGMIDFLENHPSEAVSELVQALRQDPGSSRIYLVLASAYNELHQCSDALNPLSILSNLTPESWQLHYELGRAYVGQARYETAMLEFERAQNISGPENSIVHLGKAHAMLGLADYAGAHDELDRVIRNSPDGPFAAESRELSLAVDRHLKQAAQVTPGTIARGPNAARVEH